MFQSMFGSGMNQLKCSDSACSANCTFIHNDLNTCVQYEGGHSGMVLTCNSTTYTYLYWENDSCNGVGTKLSDKVGVCVKSASGSFMNTCFDMTAAKMPLMHLPGKPATELII
jgi:hypothetical protein